MSIAYTVKIRRIFDMKKAQLQHQKCTVSYGGYVKYIDIYIGV